MKNVTPVRKVVAKNKGLARKKTLRELLNFKREREREFIRRKIRIRELTTTTKIYTGKGKTHG